MSQPTEQKSSRASGANALIALLTVVLITGAALYGVVTSATLYGAVPEPVPASAPPTEFSSARALEHVRIIAQEPHPLGSPENVAVRDYLVEELRALGLEPEVRKTTAAHYFASGYADAGTPENVLARLEGTTDSGKAFLNGTQPRLHDPSQASGSRPSASHPPCPGSGTRVGRISRCSGIGTR